MAGRARRSAGDAGDLRVRMYRVGFGDAFLIFFPGRERPRKVLVDCGSIALDNISMEAVVNQILEDAREDGEPRLDVVVATHRHRDHVSGFDHPLWSQVRVGEVWMPWTERPDDPDARRIRDAQTRLALRLQARLAASGDPDLMSVVQNSLANEAAMRTLHEGFAGAPARRFLSADKRSVRLTTGVLADVTVHVLGPSRDEEIIREMDPPVGEAFLALPATAEATAGSMPLLDEWAVDAAAFEKSDSPLWLGSDELGKLETAIGGASADELAAASLDKAINGTSLMLVFEYEGRHLLFPGDAQWGTWRRVLEDQESRSLLARTTLLKVGHHGSHNATPRDFVENLWGKGVAPEQPWALTSVRPVKKWKSVPKAELLDALLERSPRVIRSARTEPVPGFEQDVAWVEARLPVGRLARRARSARPPGNRR